MSRRSSRNQVLKYLIVLLSVSLMPFAFAHSPLNSGDNESIDTATVIPDPTKSWAVYSELHGGGEAQYDRFEISKG